MSNLQQDGRYQEAMVLLKRMALHPGQPRCGRLPLARFDPRYAGRY
ncbi:hypothetical protein ACF2JD_16455 [Aeromonas sp. A-5]